MFRRTKETETRYEFNMDELLSYFKKRDYVNMNYKVSEKGSDDEKISKEIKRSLENVKSITGFERVNQFYLIYHSENTLAMKNLFKKYMELSKQVTGKEGLYNKANIDIENYIVREDNRTTFYMIRVGSDMVKVCSPVTMEEEMKRVLKEINEFVYKREK